MCPNMPMWFKRNSPRRTQRSTENKKNLRELYGKNKLMCPNVPMWFKKNSPRRTQRSTEDKEKLSALFSRQVGFCGNNLVLYQIFDEFFPGKCSCHSNQNCLNSFFISLCRLRIPIRFGSVISATAIPENVQTMVVSVKDARKKANT